MLLVPPSPQLLQAASVHSKQAGSSEQVCTLVLRKVRCASSSFSSLVRRPYMQYYVAVEDYLNTVAKEFESGRRLDAAVFSP